ncbi:MAG: NHLP leader peptide family RiPP precursor [Actinobacteria bacterium]|nr:NHLP leader peptide family RiPP precursor [Actinomycetota bacterium]
MAERTGPEKALAAIVVRSWSDEAFRIDLLADGSAALESNGFTVPEGKQVRVVADTEDVVHLVLPLRPAGLTDEELEAVEEGWAPVPPCDFAP